MRIKIRIKKSENRLSDLGVSAVKHGPGGAGPYRNRERKQPLYSKLDSEAAKRPEL